MAPARRYAPPIQQLVGLLATARRRGLTFEEAWVEALRPHKSIVMSTTPNAPATALRWPTDKLEREAWRLALQSSRAVWQRAYEGAPVTRQERALVALSEELGLALPAIEVPPPARGMPAVERVASAA